MRKILLIIFALCALASSAFVNGNYDHQDYVRRSAVLLANAIIRYKGIDTLLTAHKSFIRHSMYITVDSLGNVKKIESLRSTNFTPGEERKQKIYSKAEADSFLKFLNDNKIRFSMSDTYHSDWGITMNEDYEINKRWVREGHEQSTLVGWPVDFKKSDFDRMLDAAQNNIVKFGQTLYDSDRAKGVDDGNIEQTEQVYNSAMMNLCLSFIVGSWELNDWLEGEQFKVDIVVDRDGLPLSVTPAMQGTSPIDNTIAGLMEDFFKSYNIRFKIPNGSMSDSEMESQCHITVDFPFSPEVMENLNPDINLNQIYRLSRTLIDK